MAPRKTTGTAIANWDEELARQAAEMAEQEDTAQGGQFFSIKAGVLTFAGSPMPNNEVAVIIADAVFENAYYEGQYDTDNPQPPICWAFGRNEKEMEPNHLVVAANNHQHNACKGCEQNEFGTADLGAGKACKNTRRLLLMSAGSLDNLGNFIPPDDPETYYANTGFGFFRLPVTSNKPYKPFADSVLKALKLPLHAVICKMKVMPDPKYQVKVIFSLIGKVPKDLIGIVMARHVQAMEQIEQPYPIPDPEEAPPPKAARGAAAKKAAGKPAARTARR